MPKITVIVPVYKVEPYLRRCIDSILIQTYTDFELILVDDGSPDACPEICDEYAQKDERIRVIHRENGGLSAARNSGLDAAKGEYIVFVDSDDWVHPEYLEYLYCAVLEHGVQLSACKFIKTGTVIESEQMQYTCNVWDGLTWFKENHVNGIVAWGKLYHRSLFQSIRYPVGKIHEDEFTTYKLLYLAGDIAVVDCKLYYYYINENSIMNSSYSVRRLARLDAIAERCEFFKEIGQRDMVSFTQKRFIYEGCNHLLKLEDLPDNQPYLKQTRKRLQRFILKYGHSLGMSPQRNKWEYSIIFPHMYRIYVKVRSKIKG